MELQEEINRRVLSILEEEPEISQRELSRRLSLSLGKTNFVIKGLLEKGWLKTRNFKNSQQKWAYAYVLTPEGLLEKSRITARYIKHKLDEYRLLEQELKSLKREHEALFRELDED